jgi:hypothetical protein
MKKIILLDTNIIYKDFWMKKTIFYKLFSSLDDLNYYWYFLQIIIDESYGKLKECLKEDEKKIKEVSARISKLINKKYDVPSLNIEDVLKTYSEQLKSLIHENEKLIIIDYPNVQHPYIVNKAVYKIKPFKQNGDGYRDALIWENIKGILLEENDSIIYFISQNISDFFDKDHQLHPDLIDELKNIKIDINRVKPYIALHLFYIEVIAKELESLTQIKDQLSSDKWELLRYDTIAKEIDRILVGKNIEYSLPDNDNSDATITWLNEIKIENINQVRKLNDDEIYINLSVAVNLYLEYFVYKWDYYANEDPEYEVMDMDWNEHYILVSISKDIDFEFELVFDNKTEEIKNIEFFIY